MDSSDRSRLQRFVDTLPAAAGVTLADPDDPTAGLAPDELVLGVGLDASSANRLLAGADGVAAVLLRSAVARDVVHGSAPVVAVPAEIGWTQLHRALLDQLGPRVIQADDELADLAQTIATLTGGLVTIEDTAARVLAYSRSSDEVDDLRRLSILGRSGPGEYLQLLRDWGVYDRLAASEEVVEIAEHPETGVRRRLAVGVFAGSRQLGTIWLQQGGAEFGANAGQALLGAARLAAPLLVGQRPRGGRGSAEQGLAALLTGRPGSAGLITELGRSARQPCVVAVFALGTTPDPASRQLRLDELQTIVTLHAVALRRQAIVGQLEDRVYLLLPHLTGVNLATPVLTAIVTAARGHLDPAVHAALGTPVATVSLAAVSRRTADRALAVESAGPVRDFAAVRSRLVVEAMLDCLAAQTDLVDPAVTELIARDAATARTLLGYLDTGSDIGRVAEQLGVHPTTVRYRLRKVAETTGLDLTDVQDRLSWQLQLRCGLRESASGG